LKAMRRKSRIEGIVFLFTGARAKSEARKAFCFLFLALSSLLILFLATSIVPLQWFELFVANTVANAYNALGAQAAVIPGEPVGITLENTSIEISYLCTGLLEAIVLASVIAASAGIPIKKRIVGACTGVAFTVAVNLARIFATLHFIASADLRTADFMHNIFFRLTLFVSIFVFYGAWFHWATKQEKRGEKENRLNKKRKSWNQNSAKDLNKRKFGE